MKDFSFYVGQCADLDKRVSKHADGFSKYTSSKRPWRQVYFEGYTTRTGVIKREINRMKSKTFIAQLISNWRNTWSS